MRWDLDGNGLVWSGVAAQFALGFPGPAAGMGCPSVDGGAAACTGYELAEDLDFDTDGDGDVDASDPDSYPNWTPIDNYEGFFEGNGRAISNLTINDSSTRFVGLFGRLASGGLVQNLGLPDANISATNSRTEAGALVGRLIGTVIASHSAGSVAGNSSSSAQIGGLIGQMMAGSRLAASYSTATVSGSQNVGGLVGTKQAGQILASYASGAVQALTGAQSLGGLVGRHDGGGVAASYASGAVETSPGAGGLTGTVSRAGDFSASYWDREATGRSDSGGGAGFSTSILQAPTSATGIYAGWVNLDLDGDGIEAESPWHFGSASQYPVLRYGGLHPTAQNGDYDLDDDGLIEVYTLAQLNAVRWDMNGDGAPSSGNETTYGEAFPGHLAGMGCPTNADDADDNDCTGYELEADLNFDTDGDGDVDADDPGSYANWTPIGGTYGAIFDGNGRVIRNLRISATAGTGLFNILSGTIRNLGLPDAQVVSTSTFSGNEVGALAVAINWGGKMIACWSSGTVNGNQAYVGGLVGSLEGGSRVAASFSTANVTGSSAVSNAGGLFGRVSGSGTQAVAVYATGTIGGQHVGGLIGDFSQNANLRASYAYATVNGRPSFSDYGVIGNTDSTGESATDVVWGGFGASSNFGCGDCGPKRSASAMQTPTSATGIYARWDNLDVDGDSVADENPWDFGTSTQFPVLSYDGLDTALQRSLLPGTAPSFGEGAVQDKAFQNGQPIARFQVPAATGGDGASLLYSASGLPPGLRFDGDGAGACGQARAICGAPGADGDYRVTIYAHDADADLESSDRGALSFSIRVFTPAATLSSSPAPLTEANLDGAQLRVTLTDTQFSGGLTKSSFRLTTNVTGLAIGALAPVAAGDTAATLTLDFDGTDFDSPRTLSVRMPASAHRLAGSLASASLPVSAAVLEATVLPRRLALHENAGATSANQGAFTLVLQAAPTATVTVAVASSDPGAVAASPDALLFSASDWNTAQTVTATARQDDDADDEAVSLRLSEASAGTLATVVATVTDDDLGRVLLDADPATAALDPGPLFLSEASADPNNALGYALRLSARPTATVSVAVASGDTGAVTLDASALLFTAQNWSTAQTLTATAAADGDALDESVLISHTANGGGYNGATARLRAAVTDDTRTGTDYDTDEDGLIEISSLAQLNAVRWDMNGDGAVAAGDQTNYNAAFGGASASMGCPAVSGAAACTGYELMQDLDFDTDGDGSTWVDNAGTIQSDSDDTYHNGGSGWEPIGPASTPSDSTHFNAEFDGNGHSIYNLFVNRNRNYSGLFAALRGGATVHSLGLPNARVQGGQGSVAPLAGALWGRVAAVWASGSAAGNTNVGGLVGATAAGATIVASYSKASAACAQQSHYAAAGLVGSNAGAIQASYATGAVTGAVCAADNQLGLVAAGDGTATMSYWDTEASGVPTSAQGVGRTTSQLQAPTAATGDYAGWDRLDLDGDGDPSEAPWDFGSASQYPALSHRGLNPALQRGDYDTDDNGLIEIRTLAQLNAIRWDLDGDGGPSSGNAAAYAKAFPHHAADMGCPTSDTDADDQDCLGYELESDLDFDTDGDGATYTLSGNTATGDSGDAYNDGGSGWDPIGPAGAGAQFNAVFDGKGHLIRNLFINRSSRSRTGLFATLHADAVVQALGLPGAWVSGNWSTAPLAGENYGRMAAVWTSGAARGLGNVGGLTGVLRQGATIVASYSTAAVACTGTGATHRVGGLAGLSQSTLASGAILASYSTGAVTGTCPTSAKAGLVSGGTAAASYWDTNLSGIDDDTDTNPPEGRTTNQLRTPISATGLYAAWDDQDVDDDGTAGAAADDVWDFGRDYQHPVLKFGGFDTALQFTLLPGSPPTFGSRTVPDKTFRKDQPIASFQIPAASGGDGGSYTYSYSGTLPQGLLFDADGRGLCGRPRAICGTPTQDGAAELTIYAHDGDPNRTDSDRASLSFTITVVTPAAAITATSPSPLEESNLDGATLTLTLTNTTFTNAATLPSFSLTTDVPGLTLDSLATVTAGDTTATLTLAHRGTGFDTLRTLSVTVAAAAHALAGPLTTGPVTVALTPGLAVRPASLSLQEDPNAGGATSANVGTYLVLLQSPPSGSVTVTATSADAAVHLDTDSTPLTRTLLFAATSWATAQTVTATAQQDGDARNESVQVTHAVTGYTGVTTGPAVTVEVQDDETASILLDANPATTTQDEAGPLALKELETSPDNSKSYTVRLGAEPSAAVTVAATSSDATKLAVNDTDTGTPGDQNSLFFTATTWATAQTLTLTAQQDNDGISESLTISHAASGATEYASLSASIAANVEDDDARGFAFDADPSTPATDDSGPLQLTEDHATDASKSYTVRLTAQPSQAVTATITSADTAALTVDDTDGDNTNGDQNWLLFTTTDWNSAQTVTLTAQSDNDGADESVAITHAASTATSSEYDSVSADFTANVTDDETPAIVLSAPSLLVPEEGSATYSVQLSTPPTASAVTVAIAGAADGLTADASAAPGIQTAMTFTPSNWNSPQTVTVSAADDQDGASESATLTHTASTASPSEYTGLIATLVASSDDNDAPSLAAAPAQLSISENGSAGSYSIRLTTQPSGEVTVTVIGALGSLTPDADDGATGDQGSVRFTATNWNTARTVTVRAANDDNALDETYRLTHSASGADYGGVAMAGPVAVTVDDDDLGALLLDADPSTAALDPGPLLLSELSSDAANARRYTARLSAAPTGGVTVAVSSAAAAKVTVDASSLTFTTANWSTAQTLTATAQDDADAQDESVTITHTASGGGYSAVSSRLQAAVSDNERTGTDYDADEDGLIEISSLAQLNAVRWDLDGDGTASSGNETAYGTAFDGASTGMGCPRDGCSGYELASDLDFDIDGDGDVDAQDTGSHPNWTPIGPAYTATFHGNGRSISRLTISNSTDLWVGLFAQLGAAARVEELGLPDANVSAAADGASAGALAGGLQGVVIASHSTGSVAAASSASRSVRAPGRRPGRADERFRRPHGGQPLEGDRFRRLRRRRPDRAQVGRRARGELRDRIDPDSEQDAQPGRADWPAIGRQHPGVLRRRPGRWPGGPGRRAGRNRRRPRLLHGQLLGPRGERARRQRRRHGPDHGRLAAAHFRHRHLRPLGPSGRGWRRHPGGGPLALRHPVAIPRPELPRHGPGVPSAATTTWTATA